MAFQFDLTTILIAAGAVHALFWAFVLMKPGKKEARKAADNVLGVLMLVIFLCISFSILYYTRYILTFPHLSGVTLTLKFLIPPLLFLYVKALLDKTISFQGHWMHFIPFAICTIYMLPYFLYSESAKIEFLIQSYDSLSWPVYIGNGFIIVQLLIYVGLIYKLIKVKEPKRKKYLPFLINNKINWQGSFIIVFTAIILLYYTAFFLNQPLKAHFVLSLTLATVIFVIGFIRVSENSSPHTDGNILPKMKYYKSGFKESNSQKYKRELIELMNKKKPHLNESLSLQQLSDELSITPNHLSQLLNEQLDQSFFDFVNYYRIQYSQKMLINPKYQHLTILAIALESGFSSKSTFYSAFKKCTGTTPGKYKAQHS